MEFVEKIDDFIVIKHGEMILFDDKDYLSN